MSGYPDEVTATYPKLWPTNPADYAWSSPGRLDVALAEVEARRVDPPTDTAT